MLECRPLEAEAFEERVLDAGLGNQIRFILEIHNWTDIEAIRSFEQFEFGHKCGDNQAGVGWRVDAPHGIGLWKVAPTLPKGTLMERIATGKGLVRLVHNRDPGENCFPSIIPLDYLR
jgi:hypothetical protein